MQLRYEAVCACKQLLVSAGVGRGTGENDAVLNTAAVYRILYIQKCKSYFALN